MVHEWRVRYPSPSRSHPGNLGVRWQVYLSNVKQPGAESEFSQGQSAWACLGEEAERYSVGDEGR